VSGTRVPAGLALARGWAADASTPPPDLDSGREALDAVRAEPPKSTLVTGGADPGDAPVLDGVTIVEIGSFFAAPFGATLLAEQGARVVKIETGDGDAIRHLMPFPELSGIKVLQGKESVVLDLAEPDGHDAMVDLVRHADVVLQTFRGGVVDRLGATADDLLAANPALVYVSAPGYGEGPPCGSKPAFAPTMGAASGMAVRNVGGVELVPSGPDLDLVTVKRTAMRLATGASSPANADGIAALGVGTALALGIYGQARHGTGDVLRTSMLSTVAHALADTSVVGPHGTPTPGPDDELYGLGPWHRLYETADGWVMVTVERPVARAALGEHLRVDLDAPDLAERLAATFLSAPAKEWEDRLLPEGIAVVAVSRYGLERTFVVADVAEELGLRAEAHHPMFDDYPRASAYVRFSRSRSVLGNAPLCGQDTERVLAELSGG
jgi:crotonobetainyl-CoA:carnitine CoA-transferase CaiB-like acyl-CoA transferase